MNNIIIKSGTSCEILKYLCEMSSQESESRSNTMIDVVGWMMFREFMPVINKEIEIYWSTDEITKQIWKNDIPLTGNEIPRFWRYCKAFK